MPPPSPSPDRPARRGLLAALAGLYLGLFSSITLGIVLMSTLFVYCSVGSAGILYPTGWNLFDGDVWVHSQLRQWRGLEMTEFEWFHWWPFDLLLALICLNLVTATLKRIPLRVVNLGVWMIHTGIITLCLGSTWYFSTKVEGDTPVVRRDVRIELPGGASTTVPAVPGARTALMGADGNWDFLVQSVDPQWSMRSGPDEGKTAFSVTVSVRGPGQAFMRQLLAGHPQYTEDIVASGDPAQPMARAIKTLGRALVDDTLLMSLEYEPQEWVYLANWVQKSWALYLRETGTEHWYQRPLAGLPLYNDYVGSLDDIWTAHGDRLTLDPLDLHVPTFEPGDPLPDTELIVSSYLRYADMEARNVPHDERLDPAATVRVRGPGGPPQVFALAAFDPRRREAADGALRLEWLDSAAEREAYLAQADPLLTFAVPGADVVLELPLTPDLHGVPADQFTPIAGTDYEYHVKFWADDLVLESASPVSMASVTLRTPERTWERWVFENPALTSDRSLDSDEPDAHDAPDAGEEHVHVEGDGHTHDEPPADPHRDPHGGRGIELDRALQTSYRPGRRPAPFTLLAGPGEQELSLFVSGLTHPLPLAVGQVMPLDENGTDLTVTSFAARTIRETRPAIVPMAQRDRDVREGKAMVKVSVPDAGSLRSSWVHNHTYPVRDLSSNLRRFRYMPTVVQLADGRSVELILSRQRLPLPTAVVLEDFVVAEEVGGFTGRTSSIRNWTSHVRFAGPDGGWTEPSPVTVNQPYEHGGYWYFQSQWDPPSGPRFAGDPSSQGLNYTVLGVGNRNGVGVQLAGCTIAVLGMLYAFYLKPVIRRRRRQQGAAPGTALGAALGTGQASVTSRTRSALGSVGTVPGERT